MLYSPYSLCFCISEVAGLSGEENLLQARPLIRLWRLLLVSY
jgi:hypothetical protein